MPESDLWVEADFPTPSVLLDAKLSDGSPRFIKRPDGTMFDLYGTATRASMAEPNCPTPGAADPLTDSSEMESRIKAEFFEKNVLTPTGKALAALTHRASARSNSGRVGVWSTMAELCEKMTKIETSDGGFTVGMEEADIFSDFSARMQLDMTGPAVNMMLSIMAKRGLFKNEVFDGRFGDLPFEFLFDNPVEEGILKQGLRAALDQRDEVRAKTTEQGYVEISVHNLCLASLRAERDEAHKKLDSVIGKFNYACNAVSEIQTDLNAVTTERNHLRDVIAKFTVPDAKPPEPSINHALRVKIGDPRRMGP